MREIICNTSPIQYLHQLGLLHILKALAGQVIIPPAQEKTIHRTPYPHIVKTEGVCGGEAIIEASVGWTKRDVKPYHNESWASALCPFYSCHWYSQGLLRPNNLKDGN